MYICLLFIVQVDMVGYARSSPVHNIYVHLLNVYIVQVDLVGYAGSSPPVQLLSNSSIRIKHMKKPPSLLFLPKIVQYFIKAILQVCLMSMSIVCISVCLKHFCEFLKGL